MASMWLTPAQAGVLDMLPDQVGVKLRSSLYFAEHQVNSDRFRHTDQDSFRQRKFPIMIAFTPSNRNYWFSQWFFDYEIPYSSLNMAPGGIDRASLRNNFLNSSEQAFADANPNWSITADFRTFALVGGYSWGLFIPLSQNHRLAKVSLGLTFGYYDYQVEFYLCSAYQLNSQRLGHDAKQSGNCSDKTYLDRATYAGLGVGAMVSLVLYEWYNKRWLFQFGTFEAGSIAGLTEDALESRPGAPALDISTVLLGSETFSVSYFF